MCPVSAGAADADAIIGARDGASAVIHHGGSVIHGNVVSEQKSNMLFCVYDFLEWKACTEHLQQQWMRTQCNFLVCHTAQSA